MRIYAASSWRSQRHDEVVTRLREAGQEVYDFKHPHMGPGARGQGFHWSEIDRDWRDWSPREFITALEDPRAVDGAASDLAGMSWADATVLTVPATAGRSSHLELGYAIGAGKPTFILLGAGEPELMYRLATHLVTTIDELVERVLAAWSPQ